MLSTTIETYYIDADGDGLGYGDGVNICDGQVPNGYSTNSVDNDDNDSNINLSSYFTTTFGAGMIISNAVYYTLTATLNSTFPFDVNVNKIEFYNSTGTKMIESTDSSVLNGNWINPNSSIAVQYSTTWNQVWTDWYVVWSCSYNGSAFSLTHTNN